MIWNDLLRCGSSRTIMEPMKSFLKIERNQNGFDLIDLSPNAPLTHSEAQLRTPDGAFTTFRTYDKYYVLNLPQHFKRLEETAALAGKTVQIDPKNLCSILVGLLNETDAPEARVRISVDLSVNLGDIYLAIEPFVPLPAAAYTDGVDTATTRIRRNNPRAKLSRFLPQAEAVRRSEKKNVDEYLMLNDNREILEGLSSNFYAVIRGEIFTAGEGVLEGTTRQFILDLINEAQLPLQFRPVSTFELNRIDEAFISSTSRSILPVRKIDQRTIGTGKPGPITRQLMQAFQRNLEKGLSDLRAF